jgi:hypothetical protein
LRNALADINRKGSVAPVPAGHENLSLIIRIDQPNDYVESNW